MLNRNIEKLKAAVEDSPTGSGTALKNRTRREAVFPKVPFSYVGHRPNGVRLCLKLRTDSMKETRQGKGKTQRKINQKPRWTHRFPKRDQNSQTTPRPNRTKEETLKTHINRHIAQLRPAHSMVQVVLAKIILGQVGNVGQLHVRDVGRLHYSDIHLRQRLWSSSNASSFFRVTSSRVDLLAEIPLERWGWAREELSNLVVGRCKGSLDMGSNRRRAGFGWGGSCVGQIAGGYVSEAFIATLRSVQCRKQRGVWPSYKVNNGPVNMCGPSLFPYLGIYGHT
jgi:hypothetical protein